MLHCSGCGGTYSSPRHMKGSYHRACKSSPAGRFNMPAQRYITPAELLAHWKKEGAACSPQ